MYDVYDNVYCSSDGDVQDEDDEDVSSDTRCDEPFPQAKSEEIQGFYRDEDEDSLTVLLPETSTDTHSGENTALRKPISTDSQESTSDRGEKDFPSTFCPEESAVSLDEDVEKGDHGICPDKSEDDVGFFNGDHLSAVCPRTLEDMIGSDKVGHVAPVAPGKPEEKHLNRTLSLLSEHMRKRKVGSEHLGSTQSIEHTRKRRESLEHSGPHVQSLRKYQVFFFAESECCSR